MRVVFFSFLFIIFCASCNEITREKNNYPNNITVSNQDGQPRDSLTFYYPFTVKRDSSLLLTNIDSFRCSWYSSNLFAAKEPILYNYYLGHDMYRFLWLRSFDKPVIISLHKDEEKIWLITKELDKQPQFIELHYISHFKPIKIKHNENNIATGIDVKPDSILKLDRQAKLILNERKNLSIDEWNRFERLLLKSNFWSKQIKNSGGIDGSEWIIEAHLKNKYWVVDKWSPKNDYRKCGEYLIGLSGLKEAIY